MSESLYTQIGKRLRSARQALGLTQADVAAQLGLSNVAYSTFESGNRAVSVEYLVKLATILRRPVTWFLGIPDELTADERDLLKLYREADAKTRKMAKIVLGL